ncbi:uncharacterized protein PFL1_03594 [Pseudozyma flocculosa PF-1]|uniref:Related to PUN1 - plasma membrane protein with a role in cell wall integrity n=2 Tax=Pseudozyma flocculosa TaxID=84751 RepID=A0A5C3F4I1_9BASI|nr:uncharacterized protein PFL1_03594 [Pseudozyma flocculosa PF-1]EPQ28791.1 hypothetical protein PFL1_03594 [Pseudozyma flocculosa PF-1]SPO39423.1 related to PUN1 - plasma membrane protein with a role in cell wall integrity [Pseudozyma flocculosa]
MFKFFCVGIGQLLTFAALVLVILANVGQLTNNIVARNIRFVSLDTTGLQDAISRSGGAAPNNLYASDQRSTIAAGNGIKRDYQWGLYNYCGGEPSGSNRDCVDSTFNFKWDPVNALLADTPQGARNEVQSFLPQNTFTDSDYLRKYSQAAFWLIFIGTILTGLAWLTGFTANRFGFFGAAIFAFLAALALGVGAAIETAIYTKARDAIGNQYGLNLDYGNALWFIWAAFVGCVLSIVPYLISCCTGRD